jgi:hypothetical protein
MQETAADVIARVNDMMTSGASLDAYQIYCSTLNELNTKLSHRASVGSASSVKKWLPNEGYDPKKRPDAAQVLARMRMQASKPEAGPAQADEVASADSKARARSSKWQPYGGYDPQKRAVPALFASEPDSREPPVKHIDKAEVDRSPTDQCRPAAGCVLAEHQSIIKVLESSQPAQVKLPKIEEAPAAPSQASPAAADELGDPAQSVSGSKKPSETDTWSGSAEKKWAVPVGYMPRKKEGGKPEIAKTGEDASRASSAAISILGSAPVKKWQANEGYWQTNEGYDPRKRPSGAAQSQFEPSRLQQAGEAEAPAIAGRAEADGPGLVRVLVEAALEDTQASNARTPSSDGQTSGGYDSQKRAAALPLPPLPPVSSSPFSPLFLPTQTMPTQMASEEVMVSDKGVSDARAARKMKMGTWTADIKQEYLDALDSINEKVAARLCGAQETSAPFVKELLVDTEGEPPPVRDKFSDSDAKKQEMSATAALTKVQEDRKKEDEEAEKTVKETLSRQSAMERRQRGMAAAKQKENIKGQSSRKATPPQLASNAPTPKLSLPLSADKNRLATATDKKSGKQKTLELDTANSKVLGLENLKKTLKQDLKDTEKELAELTPATARGNTTSITTLPDPAISTGQPRDSTSPADMFSFSKLFQVH